MKKILLYTILFSIIVLFARCNSSNTFQSEEMQVADMASTEVSVNYGAKEASSSSTFSMPADKKIIRTGSISFESRDLVKSKEFIYHLLKQKNAYVESEDASAGSTYSSISFTVRIPAIEFDGFLSLLENGDDKVVSKNIQANDVTSQYVDVESRLKTKHIYMERYQKLATTAKSTKELLEIEEQIRILQEDIDSYESTFKLLTNQIAYSTLTITFANQQDRNTSGPSFWIQLKEAFSESWIVLSSLFFGLIRFWPIIALVILLIFLFRKIRRKAVLYRRNKDPKI